MIRRPKAVLPNGASGRGQSATTVGVGGGRASGREAETTERGGRGRGCAAHRVISRPQKRCLVMRYCEMLSNWSGVINLRWPGATATASE